jgi:hypothetical protein
MVRLMGKFVSFDFPSTIVTSNLVLARILWSYGEPELAARAITLDPEVVLDIGIRAGELITSGEANTAWPDGPKLAPRSLLLAS